MQQLGYEVDSAGSVPEASALLQAQGVDGLILDLGLPGPDGLSLLSWARERAAGLPVLILTARDSIEDRLRGLNAGADDYMTKPFHMQELHARLQAMLRRARLPAYTGAAPQAAPAADSITLGSLRLSPGLQQAHLGDEALELTQREWELLALLVHRSGEVVTRDDVLNAWRAPSTEPGQGVNSNALEVYVHRLRKKLDQSGLNIRNIRGLGYLLEPRRA